MSGPLDGIKILDLTWALGGPFGTMILSDLGAETIKVERPLTGDMMRENVPFIDGVSLALTSVNRGKKSIVIDLKSKEGKSLFLDLVKHVDVVAENFVPGTMNRLGLGYEALKKENPGIIYAASSGFGQTGPYSGKPLLDIIAQSMSGLVSITGEEGGPPISAGVSIADILSGIYLAVGILGAVIERQKSGQGQMVDISILDCMVSVMELPIAHYLNTGEIFKKKGTSHQMRFPFQVFPTKDGNMALAVIGGLELWATFLSIIDKTELLSDERFLDSVSRFKYSGILEPILSEALKAKTTSEWMAEFEECGIICGPVNTIDQVVVDPQLLHRKMFVEVTDSRGRKAKVCGTPIKLSRTQRQVERGAPELGENTHEVMSTILNMDEAEIKKLEETGVITGIEYASK